MTDDQNHPVLPFVVTAPFMVVVLRALEKTMPHARRPDPQNPPGPKEAAILYGGARGGRWDEHDTGAGSGQPHEEGRQY